MALFGALYPLTPSLLYFELETFLRGTGPLDHLLASESDVVATYNRSTGRPQFEWRRRPKAVVAELPEPTQVHVHVRIDGSHNITRVVSVPLAALVTGGTQLHGYAGFVHTITFLDGTPSQQPIEEWHFFDVAPGAGGWIARMDDFEREVRTGSNRKFKEVWRRYAGASGVQLRSRLIVTGLTEFDALTWEEAEVGDALKSGQCLNPLPGGRKGLALLSSEGCEATGVNDRDAAIGQWRHQLLNADPEHMPLRFRVPHLLAPWAASDIELLARVPSRRHPTPAQVTEVRALALSGISAGEIARLVYGLDVRAVNDILSMRPMPRDD